MRIPSSSVPSHLGASANDDSKCPSCMDAGDKFIVYGSGALTLLAGLAVGFFTPIVILGVVENVKGSR